MTTASDPLRAALERQLVLLAPVAEHLAEIPADPLGPALAEWRGPAADAAARRGQELRSGWAEASRAATEAVARLRAHLAALP